MLVHFQSQPQRISLLCPSPSGNSVYTSHGLELLRFENQVDGYAARALNQESRRLGQGQ